MKKTNIFLLVILFTTFSLFLEAQSIKYFKLKKVTTITGEIIKIQYSENQEHRSPFVIIELKNKKNIQYFAEISPNWFYNIDLMKGNLIKVQGSLIIVNKKNIILTQFLTHKGEIHHFRDKHGFPLWRGSMRKEKRENRSRNQRRGRGKDRF